MVWTGQNTESLTQSGTLKGPDAERFVISAIPERGRERNLGEYVKERGNMQQSGEKRETDGERVAERVEEKKGTGTEREGEENGVCGSLLHSPLPKKLHRTQIIDNKHTLLIRRLFGGASFQEHVLQC